MPRDWIRFRRELALPNSAHRQAGEFSPMLSTLHWAEKKPNGVHPFEYEICHIVLISAFFNIARRGTYVDIKRCCIWAVDIDPIQLPTLPSLPPGINHVRCITTHGATWTFSQPGASMTRKFDIRTPRGRLEILDMVSHVSKAREGRGLRPRVGARRALRERTLLHNARNVGRPAPAKAKGGVEENGASDGVGDGGVCGLEGVAGGG